MLVTNTTIFDEHRPRCTGECVREEFDHELYYNIFRDTLPYKAKLRSKLHQIQESYQLGRDAGAFLTFYQHVDTDYLNILQLSNGFDNFIVKKKLVPPYGSVSQILLQNVVCLKEIIEEFSNNYKKKLLLNSVNTTLNGALMKVVKELDSNIESIEIDECLKFATSLFQKYANTTCFNGSEEICSLSALYDVLEIRDQLKAKKFETEILLNGLIKNFTVLMEEFIRENQTLHKTNNEVNNGGGKLKQILEYYAYHAKLCLVETSNIYKHILSNGQPSLKTEEDYINFLNDLSSANSTILSVCKQAGNDVQSLFGVKNRKELAGLIVHLLKETETNTVKMIGFNKRLMEFAENVAKKFSFSSYDERLLNQSLYDVESMNYLLNKYLSQTTKEIFKKSELYSLLYLSNAPFQKGINVCILM